MPHLPQKPHARRIQRIVLGEFQLGGEDAAFEGGAVGALDQGFPEEDVVFGDGAGGDAVGWGGGQGFVFVEETPGGDGGCHLGGEGEGRNEGIWRSAAMGLVLYFVLWLYCWMDSWNSVYSNVREFRMLCADLRPVVKTGKLLIPK